MRWRLRDWAGPLEIRPVPWRISAPLSQPGRQNSEASLRVAEALYLISTSPEIALQR